MGLNYDKMFKIIIEKRYGIEFNESVYYIGKLVEKEMSEKVLNKQKMIGINRHYGNCPTCGLIIYGEMNYCPKCGKKVEWEEE